MRLVWDWDRMGENDCIGEVKFSIISLLSTLPKSDDVFLEKTFLISSKKPDKHKSSGILTITLEFSDEQNRVNKHFGKPLNESISTAKKLGVPHLGEYLIMLLLENGTTSEGIIRIPGNKPQVMALRNKLESGQDITEDADPYDIAGVLKLYLSELPDSLIPETVYLKLTDLNFDSPSSISTLTKVLQSDIMPKHNMELLELCCKYFCELVKNTEITKMLPINLAISIGPTICLSPKLRNDTMAFMQGTKTSAALLSCLISNAKTIFKWK